MTKILVADDNSNIQKMVGLALKDQGIDVLAVGNGEAAVRKISDARPDLVLADVFMPVRNGYEVCQFVKADPSLAHIPVILLVGAFDPLDEQEAQRVGADGVLKKPFVPADPLISMVKSALQRSGGAHGNAGDSKAPEPEAGNLRGMDLLPSGAPNVPALEAIPVQAPHEAPVSAAVHESFVDEVPPRPEEVRIDSSAHPVAFGSLLETPAEETAEDESLVAANSPEFAVERDWRDRDEAETAEEEEEEEEPAAWRPEGSEEEVPAANSKKSKSSASDWRAGGFEQIAAGKSRSMGWEPVEEKPEAVETVPTASNNATETPAAPVAAQETTAVPTTTLGSALRETVGSSVSREKNPAETTAAIEETTPEPSEQRPSTDKKEAKDSWFSVSPSPWDAEIQKANQLASTWGVLTTESASAGAENKTEEAIQDVSEETKAVIEEAALPPATVEAIRDEAAQVTEDAEFVLETDAPSEGTSFYAPEEEGIVEPTSPPPATTPNMDDLVAKVLAKMNPEVLQAVTRELLKPVVEAMVKEELKSKKS